MAFYDSVKEDIRDETGATQDGDDEGEDDMPFDQLKDEAEDREDPEDAASSSDTDIEVLGDGDLADTADTGSSGDKSPSPGGTGAPEQDDTAEQGTGASREHTEETVSDGADRDTVQVLQRIEQQNQEMLDVLRGIKRSLE